MAANAAYDKLHPKRAPFKDIKEFTADLSKIKSFNTRRNMKDQSKLGATVPSSCANITP